MHGANGKHALLALQPGRRAAYIRGENHVQQNKRFPVMAMASESVNPDHVAFSARVKHVLARLHPRRSVPGVAVPPRLGEQERLRRARHALRMQAICAHSLA